MQTQKLRLISGKGGVGKTTVACALALAEARAGRRVLLAELNGRDRVAAALGIPAVGYAMRETHERLFVIDINPRQAIEEYILLTLRFETLYRALFKNRLVDSFLRLLPALGELTMLGKIWYHAEERQKGRPRFDTIVVDAPATGHARALLEAPQAVAKSVPPGPMRTNAQNLHAMLTDATRTRLHAVVTPEDMPVTEAIELGTAAQALGVPVGMAIINQVVTPLDAAAVAALWPLEQSPRWAGVPVSLARRQARAAQGERHVARLAQAMRALMHRDAHDGAGLQQGKGSHNSRGLHDVESSDGAPTVLLPQLIGAQVDAAALERLGRALMPLWAHGGHAP